MDSEETDNYRVPMGLYLKYFGSLSVELFVIY